MTGKRIRWILSFLLAALLAAGGWFLYSHTTEKSVSRSGFYFDTIISVTLYGTEDESLIDGCFALAERYENLFSATVEESDIAKINAAGGEFVTVDEETASLLRLGMDYGEKSGGAFCITVGALSDLWNISGLADTLTTENNEADASVLPSEEEIKEALSHTGDDKIEMEGQSVRLTDPLCRLDLGGIAKGYIADRMKEYLVSEGVSSAVINLGGDVVTVGTKKDGSAFSIGIQKPFDKYGEVIETVSSADCSVVTSGIYERYITVDGVLFSHIFDTKTGYPCQNELSSVTILSENAADGDAIATACLALGLSDALFFVESLDDTEAVFVTDEMAVVKSSGLR